ncbi:MAG: toll/interleukin-1 receptor domain-containing protein [Chloroflexota bacterium]
MKLFISYSHDDKSYVSELAKALGDDVSQHQVWLDKRLYGGQQWWDAILDKIDDCECFVTILTPRNVSSIFCSAELNYALSLNKPILPLVLKACEISENLAAIQHLDIGDMHIEKILRYCEKSFGEIRIEALGGKYKLPINRPSRPTLPTPKISTTTQIDKQFPIPRVAINIEEAMSSLTENSQRSYRRWIKQYLLDVCSKESQPINLQVLQLEVVIPALDGELYKELIETFQAKEFGILMRAKAKKWLAMK